MSVRTIDCGYLHPEFAAAYLVIEKGQACFVDNNTAHAVPKLMEALTASGLGPEAVAYLIVTHVHLDHAGGTSRLLEACPNATVLAHPKAAKTLIDPSRLIASAKKVYGDAEYERLYGSIDAIPAARVRSVQDGEVITLGDRRLAFFHTLGHATHHVCVHDSGSDGVFTGDTFGLRYPALQAKGLFLFPSTSPVDFDPEEASKSVQKVVATGARKVYLTHFGELENPASAAGQLQWHLQAHRRIYLEATKRPSEGSTLVAECEAALRQHFERYFESHGGLPAADTWGLIKLDLELNAAGIAHRAQKARAA